MEKKAFHFCERSLLAVRRSLPTLQNQKSALNDGTTILGHKLKLRTGRGEQGLRSEHLEGGLLVATNKTRSMTASEIVEVTTL